LALHSVRIIVSTRFTSQIPRSTSINNLLHFQTLTQISFPDPISWLSPPQPTTQSVLVFLSVIFTIFAIRRRRSRRANLAYIHQTQPGSGGAAFGTPYSGTDGPPPFTPQYPPPSHNGANYPYNYDPSSGFAPVRGHFPTIVSSLTLLLL
jgi:hypothetical protein